MICDTACPVVPDDVIVRNSSGTSTLLNFKVLNNRTGIKGTSSSEVGVSDIPNKGLIILAYESHLLKWWSVKEFTKSRNSAFLSKDEIENGSDFRNDVTFRATVSISDMLFSLPQACCIKLCQLHYGGLFPRYVL